MALGQGVKAEQVKFGGAKEIGVSGQHHAQQGRTGARRREQEYDGRFELVFLTFLSVGRVRVKNDRRRRCFRPSCDFIREISREGFDEGALVEFPRIDSDLKRLMERPSGVPSPSVNRSPDR